MRQRIPATLRGRNIQLAEKECAVCGEPFQMPAALTSKYSTCSDGCTSARRRKPAIVRTCGECGCQFTPGNKGARGEVTLFCSNPCRLAALQRVPRPTKGQGQGWLDDEGHVVLVLWNHGQRREVRRSRMVMEDAIGRPLTRTEVVHHINLIPDDDRPENLWLCRNQAEHMRIHAFTAHLQATNLVALPKASGWQPTATGEDQMVSGEQQVI